jgi:hypothetical protein
MKSKLQHPVSFEVVSQGNYALEVNHVLTLSPKNGGLYTNIYWKIIHGLLVGKIIHTFFTRNSEGGEKAFRKAKEAMGLDPDTRSLTLFHS